MKTKCLFNYLLLVWSILYTHEIYNSRDILKMKYEIFVVTCNIMVEYIAITHSRVDACRCTLILRYIIKQCKYRIMQ